MVRGAAAASRSAGSAPGAVLGLATGAIGGAIAAGSDASAKTATESIGAFREGADARIKAMDRLWRRKAFPLLLAASVLSLLGRLC